VTLMPNKAADPHPAIPERGRPIQMDTFNAGSRCYAIMVSGEPLGVLRSHFGFADAHGRSEFGDIPDLYLTFVTSLISDQWKRGALQWPHQPYSRIACLRTFVLLREAAGKQSAKTLPSSPLSACLPSVGCRVPSALTTGLAQLARMPVRPLDAFGVGTLPGRRKSCLQSRNVAKQSLANQLEEVEGKFRILKIKLCHLGIADYEHFSTSRM